MNEFDNSLKTVFIATDLAPHVDVTTTTEQLWTVDELAYYLKLQPETIRGMARRGELPGIKIGKVWRFRKSAIKKIFQEQP